MAGWIMHMMAADRLLEMGLNVETEAFLLGNIAPDCNIENADWTSFTPSREKMHWMKSKSKLTADYAAFYMEKVKEQKDWRAVSFQMGYCAHLMLDVAFMFFLRDEKRLQAAGRRIQAVKEWNSLSNSEAADFDAQKRLFGKQRVFADISAYETAYVYTHPECSYLRLNKMKPQKYDELAGLPNGAIARKIPLMTSVPEPAGLTEQIFFPYEELDMLMERTCQWIFEFLTQK